MTTPSKIKQTTVRRDETKAPKTEIVNLVEYQREKCLRRFLRKTFKGLINF